MNIKISPVTTLCRPLLLVTQTDVTARTLLEMAMAKITEREFDMLGQVGVCALIDRAGDWRGGGAKERAGVKVREDRERVWGEITKHLLPGE